RSGSRDIGIIPALPAIPGLGRTAGMSACRVAPIHGFRDNGRGPAQTAGCGLMATGRSPLSRWRCASRDQTKARSLFGISVCPEQAPAASGTFRNVTDSAFLRNIFVAMKENAQRGPLPSFRAQTGQTRAGEHVHGVGAGEGRCSVLSPVLLVRSE